VPRTVTSAARSLFRPFVGPIRAPGSRADLARPASLFCQAVRAPLSSPVWPSESSCSCGQLLVVITVSLLLNILGVRPYLTHSGIDYRSLLLFCLVWGMSGAFISLGCRV